MKNNPPEYDEQGKSNFKIIARRKVKEVLSGGIVAVSAEDDIKVGSEEVMTLFEKSLQRDNHKNIYLSKGDEFMFCLFYYRDKKTLDRIEKIMESINEKD